MARGARSLNIGSRHKAGTMLRITQPYESDARLFRGFPRGSALVKLAHGVFNMLAQQTPLLGR